MAIKNLNPKAEIAKSHQALAINIGAAGSERRNENQFGTQGNNEDAGLGRQGQLTKDGNVLLKEMQLMPRPC